MSEAEVAENIKTDAVGIIGCFQGDGLEPWRFMGDGDEIHIKFTKAIYRDRKLKLEKYKNDYEHNIAILEELIEEHIQKVKGKI